MRLSTRHKELSELIFYTDIEEYFSNLDEFRKIGSRFWHKSGKYYYLVCPVNTTGPRSPLVITGMNSIDERYAVIELHSSSVNRYFDSNWGHTSQDEVVCQILLAPPGPPPVVPEISIDINTITVQGGTTFIGSGSGSDNLLINNGIDWLDTSSQIDF